MIRCGIWATPRRLVVAVSDELRAVGRPLKLPRTRQAREHLLGQLVAHRDPHELVATCEMRRGDPIVAAATAMGLRVWLVPSVLVENVAALVEVDIAARPTSAAQLLARLPACAGLRQHLLLLQPNHGDARQMRLW